MFPCSLSTFAVSSECREREGRHQLHLSSPSAHPGAGGRPGPQLGVQAGDTRSWGCTGGSHLGSELPSFRRPRPLEGRDLPSSCPILLLGMGNRGLPFPLPQEWGKARWKEASKPWDLFPSRGRGQRKTSKRHTRFVFPSFNLKQKRHRSSKIKISFFPPSQTFTQVCLCNHPFLPSRGWGGEGAGLSRWEGRGPGTGGAKLGAQSLSKYKYTFQNSWEILPRPPPEHSPLTKGVWRGAGAWGVPGTGRLWFTVLREPPAAHCRSDDTRGPHGQWGLPRSASRCWGSRTSTPHAARSETSCTEEREEEAMGDVPAATSVPFSLKVY